ncbi:ATP-binding cassette domain-containing protein [Pseudoalteromonas sp. MMG024]|uniref:ABC transporter ATP-binding protein n=1 Tax=Pseudoalteromonas sp. MMG024 TaxID=2909980 RepID=UPI001F0092DA|nr:ATP-binding cassette domain-containing protein [Pseudoalteromonas sp. MMG024]MCF6456329.1 ATP-binding cassette domain-containing protein [Pseudoalteromonas sp. MMG024]
MTQAMIRVEEVSKQYASTKAVNQLSFAVNKGEIFALLGPNGAGKSSLVRMLVGFTKPDSGKVSIQLDGSYFSEIPANKLGYLPEDRGLYGEKTLLQNLHYFAALHGVSKQQAKQNIDYWLKRFDLLGRENEPLKSLSKGNQQKVQLITAILHSPEIVILDEPFSGLDPINQEKVVLFLAELKQQGMTVILSAHQMAMVEKMADRMMLMNKGEAVLYGSLSAIREQIGGALELEVSFSGELNAEALQTHFGDINYRLNKANTLVVTLNDKAQLNEALAILPKLGHVEHLSSRTMDLHQMYLKAIESHQKHALTEESSDE